MIPKFCSTGSSGFSFFSFSLLVVSLSFMIPNNNNPHSVLNYAKFHLLIPRRDETQRGKRDEISFPFFCYLACLYIDRGGEREEGLL